MGLRKKVSNCEGNSVQTRVPYQSGCPIPWRQETVFSVAILFLGTPHPALPHKGGGKVIRFMKVFSIRRKMNGQNDRE